jgi:hypothetical protein
LCRYTTINFTDMSRLVSSEWKELPEVGSCVKLNPGN